MQISIMNISYKDEYDAVWFCCCCFV